MPTTARTAEFLETCRKQGHKVTPQRLAIYDVAMSAVDHPTVDMLYERIRQELPAVSRDTVYRTLTLFESWGLLNSVRIGDQGLRYDPNTESHHHFVCDACGRLFDFTWEQFDKLRLPKSAARFGAPSGRQVEVHGVCHSCAKTPS